MKKQQGFKEVTITTGKVEVMLDFNPVTSKVVDIYTYADSKNSTTEQYGDEYSPKPFQRWKVGKNELFIHGSTARKSITSILKRLMSDGASICPETEEEVIEFNKVLMEYGVTILHEW